MVVPVGQAGPDGFLKHRLTSINFEEGRKRSKYRCEQLKKET
jgi:hypothetical protein